MSDIETNRKYRHIYKNCGWAELNLLLKIIEERNRKEEKIIKTIIKEKRRNETLHID